MTTKLEQDEAIITKVEQMRRWKKSLRFYKNAYEQGKQDALKNLPKVETIIVNDWQYGKDPDHAIIPAIHQRIEGFNVGEKIKIIIVKEVNHDNK